MVPDVSIIVPCYNSGMYVDACLDSLTRQTLKNIEIICINDGSTDDTWPRLCRWKNRDSRIILLEQPNAGVSAARNAGLNAANGLYIGFTDPDDYADADMFARLFSAAREYDADIVECGNYVFSDSTGQPIESKRRSPKWSFDPAASPAGFFDDSVWGRMDICVWNKLFRRSLLEKHRLRFDEILKQGGEDENFRLMAVPHAERLLLIPDCMYHYRHMRNGSLSGQSDNSIHAVCRQEFDRLLHIVGYWKQNGWLNAGLFTYGMRKLKPFFVARHSLFSHISTNQRQGILNLWNLFYQQAEGERFLPSVPERDRRLADILNSLHCPTHGFNRLVAKTGSCLPGPMGRYYALQAIMADHSRNMKNWVENLRNSGADDLFDKP